MDVESFDVLVDRYLTVNGHLRTERLYTAFVGAQGNNKAVKKMAKGFDPKGKKSAN